MSHPLRPDLSRIIGLIGMASHRTIRFTANIDGARIMLGISEGSAIHRRDSWEIPADAGYEEARDLTLRAAIELLGEEARADYRYRGEPVPPAAPESEQPGLPPGPGARRE